MKKFYMAAAFLAFWGQSDAQTLNQSAGWPNPAWSITGTFNPIASAFESDPRTTSSFAFDDDDAGSSSDDNIAAESPVIDLTPAFNANEKNISITVNYGYYFLYDALQFQYWDATAGVWVGWPGPLLAGTGTSVTDNFCNLPKVTYTSPALSIANFTPEQLAGFRYRIAYDDDLEGAGYAYGFCFNSPTIVSAACPLATGLIANNVTDQSATLAWNELVGVEGYEYVLDQTQANPAGAGTPTGDTTYLASGLTASTTYYLHVRSSCGSSFGNWATYSFTTSAPVPENDSCATAIAAGAFPYVVTQDASAATADGIINVCSGMNDGVWYTFEGTGNEVQVQLSNVIGWDPELGVYTGSCGQFVCVDQNDQGGTGGGEVVVVPTEAGVTYYVNIGHYSGSSGGINAEGPFTLTIDGFVPPAPLENETCATATAISSLPYTTTLNATASVADGVINVCSGMNDGVWYTFTGTGGAVSVELIDVLGWDPELGVYIGSCGAFECVDQSDNGGTGGGESVLINATTQGATYYINVGHYGGFSGGSEAEGLFTLVVEAGVAPTPINNDSCATATAVTTFPYTEALDATGATNNEGSIDCDGTTMNDGAWYTFTGTGNEFTIVAGAPEGWDPAIGVYAGVCGQLVCVDNVDNSAEGGDEVLTIVSVAGTTYYVNVGNYASSDEPEGPFVLEISETLATKSFSGANFRAYPNPVANVWNVSYDNTIDSIAVFNLLGQQVLTKAVNAKNAQIDLSSLTAGSYIVKLTSNDEVQSVKILKQ